MHPKFAVLLALSLLISAVAANDYIATARDTRLSLIQPAQAANSAATTDTSSPASKTSATASDSSASPEAATTPSPAAIALNQAFNSYKLNPGADTFQPVVQAFKTYIAQNGKTPAAALIKNNPTLTEMGAKALDAGSGRIWIFQRITSPRLAVVQWAQTKATTTFVGRRHRTKKVTYATSWHTQELSVPPNVTVKEARLLSSFLVLVGDEQGSALWLRGFHPTESGWAESPGHFDSIPAFLRNNVSGKIAFRGPDLIFTVARVVPAKLENNSGPATLPEADSSTYKFLLHLTDNGYSLDHHLPDGEQFAVVHQLLNALAANHTDVAKSLLLDPKLLSIPKYLGIHGKPTAGFHVTEMACPPSGAIRFRLVTGSKDDLIFDVIRYKDKNVIKAIFIAPPDNFLTEIAHVLIPYDRLTVTPPAETASAETIKPKVPH